MYYVSREYAATCFVWQLLFRKDIIYLKKEEPLPTQTLATLGARVKKRRGDKTLRETAKEIGISPATLMRVEAGRIPDVETFGKICRWLGDDPGSYLGFSAAST